MKIRLIWFLFALPLLIYSSILRSNLSEWVTLSGINLIIVAIITIIAILLVLFKNNWSFSKSKKIIGAGDIFMLIFISISMSTLFFILTLLISLIFSLLYSVIKQLILKKKDNQVPLAGVCATILVIIFILNIYFNVLPIYNDFWILSQIGLA